MTRLDRIFDLEDFEKAVRHRLPHAVYSYVAGGAETEAALRGNRDAFDDWALVPRVLAGVAGRTLETELFGRGYAAPFGVAPMGGSALVAYQGHTVMAAAAGDAGIPFILSANSIIPLEEVAAANPDTWFAAYQSPTQAAIEAMLARLQAAGIAVLVVTADVPIGSNREGDARCGFSFPIRPGWRLAFDVARHPAWVAGVLLRTWLKRGVPHIVNLEASGGPGLFDRAVAGIAAHETLDWDHIRLMRRLWPGRLIVKGILSPADAVLARDIGADGMIVSDHGGRQLDYAVAPLRALPAIRAAVPGLTVMLDGGIRRGTDVLKALALGADFVFIGRPFLFAAALAGASGMGRAIALLKREIDIDLALLGLRSIAAVDRRILFGTLHRAAGCYRGAMERVSLELPRPRPRPQAGQP